jgi:hypothetical protein
MTTTNLQNILATQQYINLYHFINEQMNVCIIIADKNIGKTWCAIQMCIDYAVEGKNFAFGRNTDVEFQASNVVSSFRKALLDRNLMDEYTVNDKGMFKNGVKSDKDNK